MLFNEDVSKYTSLYVAARYIHDERTNEGNGRLNEKKKNRCEDNGEK